MTETYTAQHLEANEFHHNMSGFKVKLKICGIQFIPCVEIYHTYQKKQNEKSKPNIRNF